MPRSSLRNFVDRGQFRRDRSEAESRAILLENLRTAEDCAVLAAHNPDRRAAFLAVARGAYEAALTY